jgi:outer membrane immunogenic protein
VWGRTTVATVRFYGTAGISHTPVLGARFGYLQRRGAMIRNLCIGLMGAVALVTSAKAADVYPRGGGSLKDGPSYAGVSWAGFYAGVNGGGAWSDQSDKFAFAPTAFGGISPSGGFGGGQIGYNWQGIWHPNLVLGAEADIQGAGIDDKATDVQGNVGLHTVKSSLDFFGTVRGRLGYASGPSLVYATGGFAYGGIKNKVDGNESSGTATGFAVGGGWEYKFNPAWSAKVEYQFIDLGRNDPPSGGRPVCSFLKCEDDAFHTVRAGLNYHILPGYEPLK